MGLTLTGDTPRAPRWTAHAPFLGAVVLLGATALLVGPGTGWLGIRHAKAALPLRAPLDQLDPSKLLPFRVVAQETLDSAVVEALGTDQYLSWLLEDPTKPEDHPLRIAHLFITYDTGGHNLVPHVPDECRLGAGYQPAEAHENIDIAAERLPALNATLPLRVCSFVKTAVFDREQVSVVYTFFANGRLVATRSEVRMLINDPAERHAFFSKVEVSFPRASREENVEGATKLLDRVLPVLMRDHYPDFEAAERQERGP